MMTTILNKTHWRVSCFLVASMMIACGQIKSSELASTEAEDLKLTAYISAVQGEEMTTVNAYMETADSETDVEFDQGETLQATSDAIDPTIGSTVTATLTAESNFIDLDNSYEGDVLQTNEEGTYSIIYKDKNNVSTTVTVDAHVSADIITPESEATVGPSEVVITWDPAKMPDTGTIFIHMNWIGTSSSGSSRTSELENTGSYTLDISSAQGNLTIGLYHEKKYIGLEGFADTDIRVRSISEVSVSIEN